MQNLLRPQQVEEFKSEEQNLENMLLEKDADKAVIHGQLRRTRKDLKDQTPVMPEGKAKDSMIQENKKLLETITTGMLSQEEMRKNPPGAVDRHLKWEREQKNNIVRWKNNELRLNAGSSDTEIANLEKYRPVKSTMNMVGAQISGTHYSLPSGKILAQNCVPDGQLDQYAAEVRANLIATAIRDDDEKLAAYLGIELEPVEDTESKGKEPVEVKQTTSKKSPPKSIL